MCTLIIGCLWALAACEPDVVRPGLQPPDEPVLAQSPEPVEIQVAPAGDTYVSRTLPAQNFGADTLLLLDGDHRPLLRWDSAAVVQAVGSGSLLEARLELTVLSNSGGWPGNARRVALHAMSEKWVEGEANWDCSSADPAPCDPWSMDEPEELEGPQGPYHSPWKPQATDSLRVMNNTDGVVTFDVTADVVAALQGGVYRHGWILKRVNESTGGGLEIGSRESGSEPRLVLTVELPEQVPAEAPDTVPAGFYDAENYRSGAVCHSGLLLRGILVLRFREGTTQMERQEAIDLIQGEVVGGIQSTEREGFYYVRVEDDEDGQILCDGMTTLDGLPQVAVAAPSMLDEPFHRRPHEGQGDWSNDAWQVDPSFVMPSERWGLEAIAAPLAWGCEIGNEQTPVAVVDAGFHAVDDLMENVPQQWRGDVGVNLTTDHGTRVASVIAARGDNGQGITGAMWRADVRLYDIMVVNGTVAAGAPPERTIDAIERAASDGSRVINLSVGDRWTVEPDSLSAADQSRVERRRSLLVDAFDAMQDPPLLTVAAGNDELDAYWAGYPAAKASFPDHILVVGASDFDGGLTATSNRGATVDILAPGDSVGVLDGVGAVITPSGTSYAAPYAAGVAGLLLAFDSTIYVGDLKGLILDGAREGGPGTEGIPLLNAYEPLKAAARRDGAPLCGSRIAVDEHTLMVERNSGWTTLLTLNGSRGWLNPPHGGRTIDAYVQNTDTQVDHQDRFTLQGGAWQHDGPAPGLPDFAGLPEGSIYNSTRGVSHDGDTTAIVTGNPDDGFRVRIIQTGDPGTVYHDHFLTPASQLSWGGGCAVKNQQESCLETRGWVEWELFSPTVSWVPMGGRVVAAVRRSVWSGAFGEWSACGEWQCRGDEVQREWSQTDLFEMHVVTGVMRPLFSVPYFVEKMAISEDGREITVERFRDEYDHYSTWWVVGLNQFGVESWLMEWSYLREQGDCAVEWHDYETGQVLASSPFERPCWSEAETWSEKTQSGSYSQTRTWFLGAMSP